jgi:putative ABC transport system ATP-binding protein
MARIVEARNRFYAGLPAALNAAIEPYDPTRYIIAATVMDNVLFGRIRHNHPEGPERIRAIIFGLLDELGLHDEVLDVGLDFNVGVGGKRLTGAQRQKLDMARALLKRADYLIFNRPLLALDQRAQDQVLRNVLEEVRRGGREPAVMWVLGNPSMAAMFDRVMAFDGGQLVADGTYETLHEANDIFRSMVS